MLWHGKSGENGGGGSGYMAMLAQDRRETHFFIGAACKTAKNRLFLFVGTDIAPKKSYVWRSAGRRIFNSDPFFEAKYF